MSIVEGGKGVEETLSKGVTFGGINVVKGGKEVFDSLVRPYVNAEMHANGSMELWNKRCRHYFHLLIPIHRTITYRDFRPTGRSELQKNIFE